MESTESSLVLHQYLVMLKRHWIPASVIFMLVMLLTILNISKQKPSYEAESKLSFKSISPTSSLTGLGREIGEIKSLVQENNPLNNELELIKSEPNVRTTIEKLQLKDRKGNTLKVKDFLKQLSVSQIRGSDILTVSYKDENPQIAALVVNTIAELYLQNNQIINRSEAVSARKFIEDQLPKAEASVRKAEADLRQFKERNNVVVLEEEAKSAVQVMAGLEAKITEARSALADANAEAEAFKKELQMNTQEALTVTSLSQSSAVQESIKNYQQIQQQLDLERTRFQDTHPLIVDLKQKQANLRAALKDQIQQVSDEKKPFPASSLQIGEVKPKLIEEFVRTETKRQGLANQVAALSTDKELYKQRISIIPKLEQQQRELENKLQTAQTTYSLLLQKFQEIRIAENQTIGNVRIIEAATVPEEPVASRKSLLLVTGVLLGSVLAVGTAIILESKDKSIRSVEETKEIFGFTVLGVIPYSRKFPRIAWSDKLTSIRLPHPKAYKEAKNDSLQTTLEIVARDIPNSPIGTAYRMLYSNLRFLNANKDIKTLVVTSCVPQEGKSTVCANLAAAVAQLGRQVLLIDANILYPFQDRIWGVSNQVGLTNLIVEQKETKTAIQEVMVNLDLLTSGLINPEPSALFESPKMTVMLEKFAAKYDLVIIDACSLNTSVDALILGRMSDGILLVSRLGVVDFVSANTGKEFLHKSGQNVLGMVVGFPKE